jgi:uncharacterized protein (DUF58 family)
MPAAAQPARVESDSILSRLRRRVHISEVWMRFLVAVVGLAFAFGAALFSTVSRESGNVWATAILASGALLLATLVGLTTVPYLARRVVAGARWQDAFDFEVTKAGIVYVVVTLLVVLAALNTGNNLLYVVVSALLAAVLASGLASAVTLRRLELGVRLPERVFAEQNVVGRLSLHNHRAWFPSLSVSVSGQPRRKSRRRWRREDGRFVFPPNRPPEQQWVNLPDIQLRRVPETPDAPAVFEGTAYFPLVPTGRDAHADLQLLFPHRGRFQQQAFVLATRFPFGLLSKRRRIRATHEVLVYPAVRPLKRLLQDSPLLSGELEALVRGQGTDLYGIREYLPEDSARFVDWKATAKSGQVKVREFTREDDRQLCLVFDNPAAGTMPAEQYERAVSLAASLGVHFASSGARISYWARDRETPELDHFLSELALVEPAPVPETLDRLPVSARFYLVVSARHRDALPPALLRASILIPAT